jgi:hypothetical protein
MELHTPVLAVPEPRVDRVTTALNGALDPFLARWGRTPWRDLIEQVEAIDSPQLIQLVDAVAGIEHDAAYMQLKLKASGLLRWEAIAYYNAVWMSEETDHGRAFDELKVRLGTDEKASNAEHGTFSRDPRAAVALLGLVALRPFRATMLAGYAVRGILVERVASAVYRTLRVELLEAGANAAAEIVGEVLLQEGRHLKFFTRVAKTVLTEYPRVVRPVRWATEATWRPPGVDLYGLARWRQLLSPILLSSEFIDEVLTIDARLGELPGFDGTQVVRQYMSRLL